LKLSLTTRGVDTLTPYERNSKNHGSGDIAAIAASITRFGFNDPIGITPEGVIVEGHGRFEAAKTLGLTEVPCIILEGGDDRQYDLYRIAHNKIALSTGFDFEVLVDTLREVSENGEVQVADMGFSQQNFDNLCDMFSPQEARTGRTAGQRPQSFEYDLIFDSKEQKDTFSRFIRKLKEENPNLEEGTLFLHFARLHMTELSTVAADATQEQTHG
jgi:hypothetical protein